MARRRFVGGPRRAGRKADLRWLFGSVVFLAQAAGNAAQVIVTGGVLTETLMRSRGEVLLWLDDIAGQTAGDLVRVTMGMLVVPSGLGTTVISSPFTDGDAPWFWFETIALGAEEAGDMFGIGYARVQVDSRAMRVIRPDQEVQFVVEASTVTAAQPVNVAVGIRFLMAS